jgi:hypothetical protein
MGNIECKGDMICQQPERGSEQIIPLTNADSELFAQPSFNRANDGPFMAVTATADPHAGPQSMPPAAKTAAPRAENGPDDGAGALEQPDEEPEEKPKVRRWRVELNKVEGLPLGFQAQVQIGMPYITVGSLQAGELVDKFNLENPDYALREGDRIIAIGGVGGESRTLLKKLARVRDLFIFDCERPLD